MTTSTAPFVIRETSRAAQALNSPAPGGFLIASDEDVYKRQPQLPDVATLKDVRLQIPMQVYSADGELIAQYGEKRRIPCLLYTSRCV